MIDDEEIYDVDGQSAEASRYLHGHGLFTESRLIDILLNEKRKLMDQLETAGSGGVEALRKRDSEIEKKATRYDWLRAQPNNTDAPRIDVVHWVSKDESSNAGEGLRMEALDAAIDAAIASQSKGEAA